MKGKISLSKAQSDYDDEITIMRIQDATEGLPRESFNYIYKKILPTNKENAITISKYIVSLKSEINPSASYRKDIINLLCSISVFFKNSKSFSKKEITRQDILAFLDSFRKSESSDPLHKWIGTYNMYRILLMRFFKWLYYPDIEPDKRPKPLVIENIPQIKRKEKSIYKPTDLWTEEDDSLFLKYCPNARDKCFHSMARDSGARPSELLKLRIKEIVFKLTPDKKQQYAEVLLNGKTGSRHIPLINSIPYLKDWVDHGHPQGGNPSSILLCGFGKSLGRSIQVISLHKIYENYKREFFPKLIDNPNVPSEDKQRIRDLLKKPWNPYIRRHSALTEKSGILKEHYLRQYAGWSPSSQMHLKYIHYFGNESSESLLEAYGIVTKDKQSLDALRPKSCPNCNEPNKPDSKFCAKCRMVLTYDAYNETIEEKEDKSKEIDKMKEQMRLMQDSQTEILTLLKDPTKLMAALNENN